MGITWDWACRLDPDGWHSFHNGAALVHSGTGEVRPVPLPQSVLDTCRKLSEAHGWPIEWASADDYVAETSDQILFDHAVLLRRIHAPRPEASLGSPVVRAQFLVPIADAEAVRAALPDDCESSTATSPALPGIGLVSVTPIGVSKVSGVLALADLNGLEAESVMMVGDGLNDLEAIRAVGCGVAMGNAEPAVLDAADVVVASVDQDGLAEALSLAMTRSG